MAYFSLQSLLAHHVRGPISYFSQGTPKFAYQQIPSQKRHMGSFYRITLILRIYLRDGQPCGQIISFVHSTLVTRGLASLDPGARPSMAHQAMLRQRPIQQSQKDLQLQYTTMYWGALGRKRKKSLAADVRSAPVFKKIKRMHLRKISLFDIESFCIRSCVHIFSLFKSPGIGLRKFSNIF